MQKKQVVKRLLAVSAVAAMFSAFGVHAQSGAQIVPSAPQHSAQGSPNLTGKTAHDGTVGNTNSQGMEDRSAMVEGGPMLAQASGSSSGSVRDQATGSSSGSAGMSGSTGTAGSATSGTAGAGAGSSVDQSGAAGTSGQAGSTSGTSGQAGTTSGTSDQSGTTGASGQSGTTSGASGQSGSSGAEGQSGTAGTQSGTSGTGAVATGGATTTQGTPATGAAKLSKADRRAVMDMAQANMAEIETAKLALSKSENADVKTYAQQMIDDHGKALSEGQALAQTKGVTLPEELDAKHKAMSAKLEKLSGDEFDRTYMKQAGVADHKQTLAKLQKSAKSVKDPDVKALAAKMVPTVEQHLKAAQQMQTAKGTTSGK